MLVVHYQFASKSLSVICRTQSTRFYLTQANVRSLLENMSSYKKKKSLEEIEKVKENQFHSNLNVKLEVLGNGAYGSSRGVLLQTDHRSYLFNCGEGLQRSAMEHKVRLSKVSHVFITYPSWENISGLIGTSLTLQHMGVPQLFIHGHNYIENIYSATTKFVVLRKLVIKQEEPKQYEEYFDGVTRIRYVHLYSSKSTNLNQNLSQAALTSPKEVVKASDTEDEDHDFETDDDYDDIDNFANVEKANNHSVGNSSKKKNHKRQKRSHSEVCKKLKVSEEKFAISFICTTIKTLGTLNIAKCCNLGVPQGPLLGKLKKGEDVELSDGTVVKSSEVTGSDTPGAVVIFVECPSEDYLDSLLKEPAFYRHQEGASNSDDIASAVVHFSSFDIVNHSKYQEWIQRFHKDTKHLFINTFNNPQGLMSVYRYQCKINLLYPEIFPMLEGSGLPNGPSPNEILIINQPHVRVPSETVDPLVKSSGSDIYEKFFYKCKDDTFILADSLCELYLRPKKDYDYSKIVVVPKETILKEVFEQKNFLEKLEELRRKMTVLEPQLIGGKKFPKILFLGTGSSVPSKTRNASGILVFVDEKNSIMFDCGEGSYSQLYHFFGREKADEVIANIRAVFVSHMHADHHLGLITLLKERELVFKERNNLPLSDLEGSANQPIEQIYEPPFLLAPIQITRWLDLVNSDFEPISHLYKLLPNFYVMEKSYCNEYLDVLCTLLNLKDIQLTTVDHCQGAFGIAITHNDGWKLTYSGDTRPCENLVQLGQDSDVLIHEATMDDGLARDALVKAHSTTSGAIQMGKKMNAKFTLLTHFSQRYPHVPLFNNKFAEDVGIAFDNMMVPHNLLPVLPHLNELLKIVFSEDYEKMEERKTYYGLRRKRKLEASKKKRSIA